ncbi:MAG: CDP-alcohol phosphatidyltransferase family protein [Acidobacteriota bacterium]
MRLFWGGLAALQAELRRVGKPREVEGVLDLYLIRPAGLLIVRAVRSTFVTANILSAMALASGWLAAFFFFEAARSGNQARFAVLAALALLVHSAFDSADGQLARWRGRTCEMGRLVDGVCDYLTFLAIYLGIALGLGMRQGAHPLILVGVGLLAALSHALQCALVEYQRNLYGHYVYGNALPVAAPGDEAGHQGREARMPGSLLQGIHLVYLKVQESLCGSSLQLQRRVAAWRRAQPGRLSRVPAAVEQNQRRRLRVWALLAPNSHKVGMVVAAMLPVNDLSMFGTFGLLWYFLYVLVALNGLLLILLISQPRADRAMWARIQDPVTTSRYATGPV